MRSILCVLLLSSIVVAAPAPIPQWSGKWVVKWSGGALYHIHLHADGRYEATMPGQRRYMPYPYLEEGTWRDDGDGVVLEYMTDIKNPSGGFKMRNRWLFNPPGKDGWRPTSDGNFIRRLRK
jgi:hypothetical protein